LGQYKEDQDCSQWRLAASRLAVIQAKLAIVQESMQRKPAMVRDMLPAVELGQAPAAPPSDSRLDRMREQGSDPMELDEPAKC
jgi:hypothetical protein